MELLTKEEVARIEDSFANGMADESTFPGVPYWWDQNDFMICKLPSGKWAAFADFEELRLYRNILMRKERDAFDAMFYEYQRDIYNALHEGEETMPATIRLIDENKNDVTAHATIEAALDAFKGKAAADSEACSVGAYDTDKGRFWNVANYGKHNDCDTYAAALDAPNWIDEYGVVYRAEDYVVWYAV